MASFCYLLSILLLHVCLPRPNTAVQLPDLYWNSSNPVFDPHEPPLLSVWLKDRLNIHCPYYPEGKTGDRAVEYSTISQVSKWGYDNCVLDGQARILLTCADPFISTRPLSITFREWSPNPGAPEFKPGQSYYFISTSGGSSSGLRQSIGGLCGEHGLRLKIDVHGYRPRAVSGAIRSREKEDYPSFNAVPDFEPPTPNHHIFSSVELPSSPLLISPPPDRFHGNLVQAHYDYLADSPSDPDDSILPSSRSDPAGGGGWSSGEQYYARTSGLETMEVLVEYADANSSSNQSGFRISGAWLLTVCLIALLPR